MKNTINLCILGPTSIFDDTVESVADLIRLTGKAPIISRNQILQDCTNIIWGAGTHYSPSFNNIYKICTKENTIIFNMEQIDSDSSLVTGEYLHFLSNYKVLDYSSHNVRSLLRNFPGIIANEFPLLPSLYFSHDHKRGIIDKKYHFAFYGALNQRRERIINNLINIGVKIKIIFNKYGQNLSSELIECMAVLNIHYYETGIFESARVLRPVSMGIPILSEKSILPSKVNWNLANIDFVDYNNIESAALTLINNDFKISKTNLSDSLNIDFIGFHFRNSELISGIPSLIEL